MAWVKLDDQFFRNPKIIAAGRDARDLYMASLCYAASALTDGVIATGALRMLGAEADIDDSKGAAERLVECGLWDRHEKGFRVHDYHDYNPTAEKVLAERSAAQERMRKARSGEVQPNNERTSPNPVPVPRPVPSPVPTPVPTPEPSSVPDEKRVNESPEIDKTDDEPTPIAAKSGYSDEFESFWRDYPRDHGTKSKAFAEWKRLTRAERIAAQESLPAFRLGERWQRGFILDCHRFLKEKAFETPPLPWSPPITELPAPLKKRVDAWVLERTSERKPIMPYPDQLAADIDDWRQSQRLGAA